MSGEPTFTPAASAEEEELIAALRRVPGVSAVNTKPQKPASRPNHFGVTYQLKLPSESKAKAKRKACTAMDVDQPRRSIADCVKAVLGDLREQLGAGEVDSAMLLAEEAPVPATAAELEWLSIWCESHEAPETITFEMAEAALIERRARARDGAAAGAASSGPDAVSVLQKTQLLKAQLSGAERRAERASVILEQCRERLATHHAPKQQRLEAASAVPDHPRVARGEANPPNWQHYHQYSHSTYQKLETEEQDRRAIPIDRDRLEHSLPRGADTEAGETRGWFSHWRRGVGPTFRGWAAGSLGAIIHMLAVTAAKFDVVDEVGAELGFLSREQVRALAPLPPALPPAPLLYPLRRHPLAVASAYTITSDSHCHLLLPHPRAQRPCRPGRPRRASTPWAARAPCSRTSSGRGPRSRGRTTT